MSKCIRYLKAARRYEHIVIVMIINKVVIANISQFNNYPQLQSVLIVSSDSNNSDGILGETNKETYIFSDYQTMIIKLQQLTNDDQQTFNNNIFNTFDPNGRSLRDVHQNLGPFVWSHSYTGLFP